MARQRPPGLQTVGKFNKYKHVKTVSLSLLLDGAITGDLMFSSVILTFPLFSTERVLLSIIKKNVTRNTP